MLDRIKEHFGYGETEGLTVDQYFAQATIVLVIGCLIATGVILIAHYFGWF
ncbi:MAG TPA: hypothetical protein VMW50_05040 [Dehalococcoidia bacterium]|nr:hypothetical protein [Dehalococcoidia bacterium]